MPRLGSEHHHAKLTDEQIKDMRQLYQDWKKAGARKGYGSLADLFGCGESTVRDIVQYRTRYTA